VTDYKTGGGLEDWVDAAGFLKGTRLPMAVYRLMAEAAATRSANAEGGALPRIDLEVLGVGPRFDRDPETARAALADGAFEPLRQGVVESIRVLLALPERGLYPLHADERRCAWCVFDRACRRGHAATLERLEACADLRDLRRVRRKQKRKPLLADAGPEMEEP
jgi:hypothetical protein